MNYDDQRFFMKGEQINLCQWIFFGSLQNKTKKLSVRTVKKAGDIFLKVQEYD